MNITYRADNDTLYIAIEGRVDASNAEAVEEKVFEIRRENSGKRTVIDADKLEYLSSAGLRVILKLRKAEPTVAIINVSNEVYSVLDMTGFTDMITVEKAYRRISVDNCEFLAKGANGAVYRYDDETIVKVYFSPDSLSEIKKERENARKAFVLGVNTAIPYDIVRVGDDYGTVAELINAKSLAKLIKNDPSNLQTYARQYTDMLKNIHSIKVSAGEVDDIKKKARSWAEFVTDHIPGEYGKKLLYLIDSVPDTNTLLHGDYHTNNVMIQNGEPLLIDMDTLSMGHPVFELAAMYNAFLGFSELDHTVTERFFGYTRDVSEKFFDMSLKMYLETDDDEVCKSVVEKAMVIGYTRLLRRSIRRFDKEGEAELIKHCKERLCTLLDKTETLDF